MTSLLSLRSNTKLIRNDLETFVIVEEILTMCAVGERVESSWENG